MFEVPTLDCGYDATALEPTRKLTGLLDTLPDKCRNCAKLGEFASAAVAEVINHIDSQHAADHADELEAQESIVALDFADRFVENEAGAAVHVQVERQPRVSVIAPNTSQYTALRAMIAETDKESALVAIDDLESKLADCKRTNSC